ncbi:glycosyltransferase family 4 protein [uncultured Gemella sp.]|uniref:glycosyltransferase family 4 protein n=1 Tax=uncultured Gemella sp. TaxID=254352 RepID=UPI0028D4E441|nr:glycosyltransferase family 4 protein [uncultured Gemella sp.]
MRILHVLAQLPIKTGSGVYFTNVIEGLKQYDVKQAAVYATTSEYNFNFVDEKYEVEFQGKDISFPIVGMSDIMPYENTLYKNMSYDMMEEWQNAFRRKLEAAKEEFKPDVIITHHLWVLSSIVCDVFEDKKVIGVCHNTDIRQAEKNRIMKDNYVKNLGKLDKILALSSGAIEEISNIYNFPKERIVNIGAGYNEKIFYPVKKYENHDNVKILYAGKFDESKGFYELIKAFRLLEVKDDNVELELIGNLKEEDRLRVEELVGDSTKIRIYNAVDQVHLGEIMRHKDVFILPSYFEGLGLIAVEALGSGLRVVATEIEGLIEFLGEKINSSEIIEYIKMPTIYDTDKAVEEEKPAFINRIVEALELMIERTRENRKIPVDLLEEIERHSWKKKIEIIYELL